MATYSAIKKQIAQLEKQAVELRKTEAAKAITSIRNLMAEYELSVDDLGLGQVTGKAKSAIRSAAPKVAKPPRAKALKIFKASQPKYMDPKSGKTWTGHGKAPSWIAAATKKGRRDDFLVSRVLASKEGQALQQAALAAAKAAVSKVAAAQQAPAKKAVVKTSKPAAKKLKASTSAKKPVPSTKKAASPAKKKPAATPKKAAQKPLVKAKTATTTVKKAPAKPVSATAATATAPSKAD